MKANEIVKEIKDCSLTELKERARGLAEECMRLRFQKVSGQLQKAHRLRVAKRDLARVLTFLHAKGILRAKGNSEEKRVSS